MYVVFAIYSINDLYTCTNILKLFLFADDTTVLFSSNGLPDLINTMNNELVFLTDWFSANMLSLNVEKTNYMLFSNRSATAPHLDLLLCNQPVVNVHSTKFLGLLIDDKLTWKNHIQLVEKKLSTANFIIRNIRYKINQTTALKIYDTLISSFLTYCNILWGNTCKTYLVNIYRLQKRALRVCCEIKNLCSDVLFNTCNKLVLHNINKLQIAMLVHRYYYNVCDLPDSIIALFVKVSNIHFHHTRSIDNLCLFTNFGRLNGRKNSVKIYAPMISQLLVLRFHLVWCIVRLRGRSLFDCKSRHFSKWRPNGYL